MLKKIGTGMALLVIFLALGATVYFQTRPGLEDLGFPYPDAQPQQPSAVVVA